MPKTEIKKNRRKENDKERASVCILYISSCITRLPRAFVPPTPPLPSVAARILEASAVRGINISATRLSADRCGLSP